MRGLCGTNPCSDLLCFYSSNLCWANEQTIKKVKGKVLKGLSFVFAVGVDIMGGVISVQSGNIRQLHDVVVKDLHLAQRLNADTKSLGWLLFRQTRVVCVNVLRGDIKRLSVHGTCGLVPCHLAALICLAEQGGDAVRDMRAEFGGSGCDADGRCRKSLSAPDVDITIVSFNLTAASVWSSPVIDRVTLAVRASADKFVMIVVIPDHRRLTMDIMDNVPRAAPNTVSNKKSHHSPPEKPYRSLNNGQQHAQEELA